MDMEQVREKIRANFPKEARSTPAPLRFERETRNTLVSTCNRFRVSKQVEAGITVYYAWMGQKRIGGHFVTPDQAKEALQFLAQ